MPGNFAQADVSIPNLSQYGTTDAKINALENYLRLLLENLQYSLRHLDLSNMNESEMEQFVSDTVRAKELISNTVITNEIYSDYGSVADLTVNRLRTDYKKAQYFMYGITDPIDYISIHDEELEFISAEYAGGGFDQLHEGDKYFYWKDASQTQMTSEEVTDFPVFVFIYNELVKGSIKFGSGQAARIPILTLGAGIPSDQTGTYSKARIWKDTDGLYIQYTTNHGDVRRILMLNDGTIKFDGPVVLSSDSYGTDPPSGIPVDGQLYFQVI